MRLVGISIAALALSACADTIPLMRGQETPEQTAARRERERERQTTERFAVCMDRLVGRTGVFVAPEAKRKAAETCNEVAKATPVSTTQ